MRLFMMFCVMLLLAGCDTRTSVERAQEAGVLIVGNNAEPQSFDPHIATSVSDFKMINAVMEGLLRGDSAARAAFYQTMTQIGAMTINEVRQRENLPGVEGGDTPRMQSQNIPITQTISQEQSNADA